MHQDFQKTVCPPNQRDTGFQTWLLPAAFFPDFGCKNRPYTY